MKSVITRRMFVSLMPGMAAGAMCGKQGAANANSGEALPGENCESLTQDGAWCWFADPRSVCDAGGRTFASWVDSEGNITVASHDPMTSRIDVAVLRDRLQKDDHANPAILRLPDHRLMVFYSAHNGDTMYYRVSSRPGSVVSWDTERILGTNTGGRFGYTYPNPYLVGDDIWLFWRGGDFKPNYAVSSDGVSWSPARTLIEGTGARPYVKYARRGDSIHLAFTDGHPRNELTNRIWYACIRENALCRADGGRIASLDDVPVNPESAHLVYDGVSGGRGWIWDIALDSDGRPVIVYGAYPAENDHRYRYARWDGSRWSDSEITAAGGWFPSTPEGTTEREPHYSGGVVLDHDNPAVVYCSRPIGGVYEIERFETPDGGVTWLSNPVTSGSSMNNIRPVVPRRRIPGGIEVLWMHGGYIHYTDYRTSIRFIRSRP